MSAPKGNKFYLKREKNGRERLIAKPEILLKKAYEYFNWCIKNPLKKSEAIKGGREAGTIIEVPSDRPFTLIGLCVYCGISLDTFKNYEKDKDYFAVCTHIREVVEQNQVEGAMSGTYKENIVARLLGLAEKREVDIPNGLHIEVTSPATKKAIEQLQDKLQTE